MTSLLRIPIFYKILLANSLIVGLGATVGTVVTVWRVRSLPQDVQVELIAFFAVSGIIISFFVNRWVLARALEPLDRVQTAVNQVRQGKKKVRVTLGKISDEQFDRLVETFNQMLAQHEKSTQQMQQLPRQIIKAQEEERQRLSRELHDEAAQALTSLLVHIRLLERAHDPEQAQKQVKTLRQLTAQALDEVRRVSLDLRPTILDDLGLAAALEWRVDEFIQSSGLQANVKISGMEQRLPAELELVFYRVGQEALSNVVRHAKAQNVSVSLQQRSGVVNLEVTDDGAGFDVNSIPVRGLRGLGLLGMRERLATINGTLKIESEPGCGARISAYAPLNPESEAAVGDDHG